MFWIDRIDVVVLEIFSLMLDSVEVVVVDVVVELVDWFNSMVDIGISVVVVFIMIDVVADVVILDELERFANCWLGVCSSLDVDIYKTPSNVQLTSCLTSTQ